jgi:hypothetical protein
MPDVADGSFSSYRRCLRKVRLAPTPAEIDASDAARSNSRNSGKRPVHGVFGMTKKSPIPKGSKKQAKIAHPGMMGDGTEEQNLGERGNPAARIRKKEVVAAFGKKRPTK